MPTSLKDVLVIGISTRALFDLEHENKIFATQGLEVYSLYQLEHENLLLAPGFGYPLVRSLLHLNTLVEGGVAEVVIMSRNNADASLRIFHAIKHYGLGITRGAFTSGASLAPYLRAFDIDLFLSAEEEDVQGAVDAGCAAALVYAPPENASFPEDQVRIAFDGDAVIFSEESELVYREKGLEGFIEHETTNVNRPLTAGPFARLLKTISYLQARLGEDAHPIRTALVTARNSPAHERVIRTLRDWGVRIDEVFFMGGVDKSGILRAFRPHIFFDDQSMHLDGAARIVPSARVPYPRGPVP